MRIVVTGLIATYPLGGVAWDYQAYVSGFRRLGHDVFYLEDTGQWLYDPRLGSFTEATDFHTAYLADCLGRAGAEMRERWALRGPDGVYHGRSLAEVESICSAADLFLNVSGSCWLRDEYRGAKRLAYLDSDPCYSQAKLSAALRGTATDDQLFSVNLIQAHNCFFTFAENIAAPDCRVPACGIDWHPTRQPIVIEDWPLEFDAQAAAYTTVMSWKLDTTLPTIDGVQYGGKDVEFAKFLDLPSRTPAILEMAISGKAPRDMLTAKGWRVVDAYERSSSMDIYRDYLRHSRGEWSVAKNAYVASRSGWFSTRSAAYLALGKPVVVQDTGFRPYYEVGEGILAFSDLDEAAAAIAAVESDYRRHCDAARAAAAREFGVERVLGQLLRDAGL